MICNECGMKNKEGNSFCTNCGCALQLSSIQEIASTGNVKVFKTPVYKKWWFWLAIALNIIVIALIWYSSHMFGERLDFCNGKNELYYTSNVTKTEAERLGSYLVKQEFFIDDGIKRTAQLDKKGECYEYRFVVKKGCEQDKELEDECKQLCTELSQNVFEGKPVDIHLCDEYLETLKVIETN